MKFLVFADIHDNLANLEKCLNWGKGRGIDSAICAGDLANGETLAYLAGNLKTVYLVRGNLEIYEEVEVHRYGNIKYLGRSGVFAVEGKTVGLCHEPWFMETIGQKKKCDMIFYGHTHEPRLEEKNGATTANPGTLGGVFNKASFAVWDSKTGNLELKILELI